jgi:hypothetical protein
MDVPSMHASGMEAARMRKKNKKPLRRKIVLRLPDLDHSKNVVLNSLSSANSRRNCKFAMDNSSPGTFPSPPIPESSRGAEISALLARKQPIHQ